MWWLPGFLLARTLPMPLPLLPGFLPFDSQASFLLTPATLQPLALVASPKLGLRQKENKSSTPPPNKTCMERPVSIIHCPHQIQLEMLLMFLCERKNSTPVRFWATHSEHSWSCCEASESSTFFGFFSVFIWLRNVRDACCCCWSFAAAVVAPVDYEVHHLPTMNYTLSTLKAYVYVWVVSLIILLPQTTHNQHQNMSMHKWWTSSSSYHELHTFHTKSICLCMGS